LVGTVLLGLFCALCLLSSIRTYVHLIQLAETWMCRQRLLPVQSPEPSRRITDHIDVSVGTRASAVRDRLVPWGPYIPVRISCVRAGRHESDIEY